MALHGVELQVPLEVLGIEPGDGKAVAEASLRGGGREEGREAMAGVRGFHHQDGENKSLGAAVLLYLERNRAKILIL